MTSSVSQSAGRNRLFLNRSVSAQTLSDFFDHLATLLASGIPLLSALSFVQKSSRSRVLQNVLEQVTERVRSGTQLSEALAEFPDIFDAIVLGMLRASEASGQLEAILKELALAYGKQAEMQSKFLQAIAYPALVAGFGFVTVLILLVFVVPKLSTIFEVWDAPLPLVTQILLTVSNFLSKGGFLILVGVLAVLVALILFLPKEQKRNIALTSVSGIPFFQRLIFLTDFVRLMRTWGMLLRSGVPLVEAIRASEDVVWEPHVKSSLSEIRDQTLKGSSLLESVQEKKWFPELAKSFLSVGEETGTLDQSFEKIAHFFERELDQRLKVFATFLEPLLILGIGLLVGFLVISLLLPIFEMSLVVR